jgi:YkoY family integral membrane protein
MVLDLFAALDWSSVFTVQAAYVIVALVVIEGLLSVDNALAIAALASHLDEKQRKVAMTIGYAGAYGFRLLALMLAGVIINNHYLMAFGAGYLIWLMCNHFAESEDEDEHPGAAGKARHSFAKTIAMIALLDLSLSFDNVVAAVAFARENIYLVYLGVTIGIITLRLVAGYCIKLLERHPWLEHTAFLLVGFVGILLCTELYWDTFVKTEVALFDLPIIHNEVGHYHIQKGAKFGGIFLVLIGHLAFEKVPGVRLAAHPFVVACRHVFAVVARAINSMVAALLWPFRAALAARA